MDSFRPYSGHGSTARRRRSSATGKPDVKTAKRTAKLIVCVAVFALAVIMKFVFPQTLQAVGDKLNTAVNYRAALASLGEGLSGKKQFVTALGEAFAYAFKGEASGEQDTAVQTSGNDKKSAVSSPPAKAPQQTVPSAAAQNGASVTSPGKTVETFAQESSPAPSNAGKGAGSTEKEAAKSKVSADTASTDGEKTFSDAVIAAFLHDQEQFSDYAIPAGVSYSMPKIGISIIAPVNGVVSSPFGYRIHPVDKTVKFHYGTDIAAKEGTPIVALADGKVISAGDSSTLGNYVILKHGGVESEYAHCGKILVASGQTVKKGDRVATVGKTGNATETCLHFELRISGVCVNPEYYIQWS